jgi:hypothetical protein
MRQKVPTAWHGLDIQMTGQCDPCNAIPAALNVGFEHVSVSTDYTIIHATAGWRHLKAVALNAMAHFALFENDPARFMGALVKQFSTSSNSMRVSVGKIGMFFSTSIFSAPLLLAPKNLMPASTIIIPKCPDYTSFFRCAAGAFGRISAFSCRFIRGQIAFLTRSAMFIPATMESPSETPSR